MAPESRQHMRGNFGKGRAAKTFVCTREQMVVRALLIEGDDGAPVSGHVLSSIFNRRQSSNTYFHIAYPYRSEVPNPSEVPCDN